MEPNKLPINIALVDDDVILVKLLADFFARKDEINVVFAAYDGDEVLAKIAAHETVPDIILLDLRMKNMNGIETTELLKEHYPEVRIIVMSSYYKKTFLGYMLKSGVDAFLPKEIDPEQLLEIIISVRQKGFYFTQDHIDVMRNQLSSKLPKPVLSEKNLLTSREHEILVLLCQQLSAKEIADKLFITRRTVEGHKSNLFLKTGVKNTAGLVIYAIQNEILNPNELFLPA